MRKEYIRGKKCSVCKVLKALSEFGCVESKGPGKIHESRCKECRKEANRRRRATATPEQRAKVAEKSRRWREENREESRAYQREWKAGHPGYQRERRLARLGVTEDLLWEMHESQGGVCAYCETPLFDVFHLEHMTPISRGGKSEVENYALSCPTCNLRKATKTVVEYMEYLTSRT